MVQQCHAWCAGCKCAWFWLGSAAWNLPNFWQAAVPNRHGMSKISHTEPSQHCNITHWTHIEEMKWFSLVILDVLTAINLGFGLASSINLKILFSKYCFFTVPIYWEKYNILILWICINNTAHQYLDTAWQYHWSWNYQYLFTVKYCFCVLLVQFLCIDDTETTEHFYCYALYIYAVFLCINDILY